MAMLHNKPKIKTESTPESLRQLILFNDDINTFDFVIQVLIEVCEHEHDQAEQCALIAHFKGQCIVKNGELKFLLHIQEEMTQRGLSVSVE